MGTTTAGMTVLRLEDGEFLLVDVVGLGMGLLEDEDCGFEEAEVVPVTAAAALRLIYCVVYGVMYGVMYVVVDVSDAIERADAGAEIIEIEIIDGREVESDMLFK